MKPLALAILAMGSFAHSAEKPNILFIYTDDQSVRTVSSYEASYSWVNTPNIDRLANEGVRFSRAHIGSWCMASRASILTGLQQHRVESMRMTGPNPHSDYDPEKCPFWPKYLRTQGYYTAQIGKWHTGVDSGYGRDWDYQVVWNRPKYPENAPFYYYNQLIEINGSETRIEEGYTTDRYTDWAIDFIQQRKTNADKPWFLWLCYGAVHGPFTPANRHLNAYENATTPDIADLYPPRDGKPEYVKNMEFWERDENGEPVEKARQGETPLGMKDLPGRPLKDWIRQYQQGVLAIDENVGRLMRTLKESGQDENTIVVFTSDQGFAWGQHGMKSKVAPHYAAIAAPLIFRLPEALRRKKSVGSVVDQPVTGVDLPVTLLSLARVALPWKMHGHDLTPLLEDPDTNWDIPSLLVHTARRYGSDTRVIPGKEDPELYHGPGIPWYVMLASGNYKYVRTLIEGEIEELYDLDDDPDELKNLALDARHEKILRKLRSKAIEELKRTEAPFVESLPSVATR